MSALEIDQVRFGYRAQAGSPAHDTVQGISLALAPGAIECLIGRSGCGKTTLLKLAAGLLAPHSGQVRWQGQTVTKPTPAMGFVFQSPTLLDWLSALDNVLLPLSLHGAVSTAQRERGMQLLAQMDLAELAGQRPRQLSGGQQSRVAMARALITQPQVLFMDEPFAALDAITRSELQQDFLALCQAQGTSVLFVTHDISEAVYLADHVCVMRAGQILERLAIDLPRPRQPALRYTPAFNAYAEQLRQSMEGIP